MSLRDFFQAEDEPPRIDLGPMIDMVFLLLLFFMVATTFDRNDAIRIEKAQAKSARPLEDERFKVLVDSVGGYHVGARAVNLSEVLDEARGWLQVHPGGAVLLVPDRRGPLEPFLKVLDELKEAGVKSLAIGANHAPAQSAPGKGGAPR